MDSILKFKEAAKAFQEDERYLSFDKARRANDSDPVLQNMISEFNLVRADLNNEMGKEERDDDKVQKLNTRINELYNGIMGNEAMLAYNRAKEDIEGFMNYVNAIMNAAIDGSDPMLVDEPAADCGGSCDSCAGCG